MSSLLQHHGCTTTPRPGKVELLLSLEHWEESPMACQNCGRPLSFPLEKEHVCECGHAIADVFHRTQDQSRQSPGESTHWRLWEHWSDEFNARCRSGAVKYTYASNHWRTVESEPVKVDGVKGTVPKLYRIFRRPLGMFGCWVTFRYNGETHAPDLSVPTRVEKLPRDAIALTDDEAARYWRS